MTHFKPLRRKLALLICPELQVSIDYAERTAM